jgi:hypothetical protein
VPPAPLDGADGTRTPYGNRRAVANGAGEVYGAIVGRWAQLPTRALRPSHLGCPDAPSRSARIKDQKIFCDLTDLGNCCWASPSPPISTRPARSQAAPRSNRPDEHRLHSSQHPRSPRHDRPGDELRRDSRVQGAAIKTRLQYCDQVAAIARVLPVLRSGSRVRGQVMLEVSARPGPRHPVHHHRLGGPQPERPGRAAARRRHLRLRPRRNLPPPVPVRTVALTAGLRPPQPLASGRDGVRCGTGRKRSRRP